MSLGLGRTRRRFFYRWLRNRTATLAAVLCALTLLVATALAKTSIATIDAELQMNWRGSYDLLVADGGAVAHQAQATDGLIEQNFAAFTGRGGITADRLAKIRALESVEVAAPLTFIGSITSPGYAVQVGAVDPSAATSKLFFTDRPKAYAVSMRVTADDGVRKQVLNTGAGALAFSRGSGTGAVGAVGDIRDASISTSGDGTWDVEGSFQALPELSSDVVAIDPVAERALLGDAGDFLTPLITFDELLSSGAGPAALSELIPRRYSYEKLSLANGELSEPPVPVVLSDTAYQSVEAEVTIRTIDLPTNAELFIDNAQRPPELSDEGAALLASAPKGPAVVSTTDLSSLLVPLAEPVLGVALPDAPAAPRGQLVTSNPGLTPSLVLRSSYTVPDADTLSAAPVASTLVQSTPLGKIILTSTASEQAYRSGGDAVAGGASPAFFAPVGEYSPTHTASDTGQASYVPLGSYATGSAKVTQPGIWQGRTLGPSFSGMGSVLAAPGAITTLAAMTRVRSDATIDLLRVRLSGVSDYGPASLAEIERVASAISELGLDVRVVAGSSLAPVGIYLPQFFADGVDLGWTLQEWTSLGAAVRVDRASRGAVNWMLALSSISAVVLAGAAQLLASTSRRKEATLLTHLGWTRRRIVGWFLIESSPQIALVVSVAGMSVALTRANRGPLLVAGAVVFGFTLTAALGALLPLVGGRSARPLPASAPPARTRTRVGRRLGSTRRLAMVLLAGAQAILGLTTAGSVGSLLAARASGGSSRLAELLSGRLVPFVLALTLAGLASGVALLRAGTAALLDGCAPDLRLLESCGWSRSDVSRAAVAMISRATLPGAMVALLLATALAPQLVPRQLPAVLLPTITVIAVGLATTWVVAWTRGLHA